MFRYLYSHNYICNNCLFKFINNENQCKANINNYIIDFIIILTK